VDTLTGYGEGVTHLRDRRGRMRLLAFPRGRSRASIGAGESVRALRTAAGWHLTVHGRRTRRYSLQASLTTLRRPLRPCAVTVRGRRLGRRAWSHDRAAGVLRARFRLRSGTVTVKRRCRRAPRAR
jgi:hypothetical protein